MQEHRWTMQLRDKPSLCPLTALAGRVERCQLYTCAKSRSVLVSCRKVPLASQAPKRSPRLRSLVAWLHRFFAGKAGVTVQKVGADDSIVASSSFLGHQYCGEQRNRTDGMSESLTGPGKKHRRDTDAILCRAKLPEVDALYFCYRALTWPL